MKHSKSGLFLMELITTILFFSLTSVICVQLFVKSKTISQDSVNNNNCVIWTQNLSNCFINTDGNLAKISELLGGKYLTQSDFYKTTPTQTFTSEDNIEPVTAPTPSFNLKEHSNMDYYYDFTSSYSFIFTQNKIIKKISEGVILYFDKDWNLITSNYYNNSDKTAAYYVTLLTYENNIDNPENLINSAIFIYDLTKSKNIYSIDIVHHIAERIEIN